MIPRIVTSAALAVCIFATAAPAHAGFWSSIGSFLSGPFTSAAPNHPSLRTYGQTTVVRQTTRVNGRTVVRYVTVPLSSSRAPSNSQNNYGCGVCGNGFSVNPNK